MILWLLALACNSDVQAVLDEDGLSTQDRLGLSDDEVSQILDFLNDCGTTFDLLDGDVGLDSDAARNLVDTRDGADNACGTGDDATYGTLDAVADVSQVGDQTIRSILAWLQGGSDSGGGGGGDDGEWEGVPFSDEEATAVLEIANDASYDVLDVDVGLAADEATNIVDARPIADMDALSAVPQVGASALQKLKDFIPQWDG